MVTFEFQVKDPGGLGPAAAGELVKEALKCTGRVQIRKGDKNGDAKLIFHVLSLSLKAGERAELLVEGEKEQEEAARLESFVREHI